MKEKCKNDGFTLIELLVVISIISIFSSVVLVGLNSARQKAKNSFVTGSVSSYIVALKSYYTDKGYYPAPSDSGYPVDCLGKINYYCLGEWSNSYVDYPAFNEQLRPYVPSLSDPSPYYSGNDSSLRGAAFECLQINYNNNTCLNGEVIWTVDSSNYKNTNCGNIGGAKILASVNLSSPDGFIAPQTVCSLTI